MEHIHPARCAAADKEKMRMERGERDELLVARAVAGDQQAFADLVRDCQHTLFTAAMALTHNEADALDAVQEGILKGWQKLSTLNERKYFRTWLTRIVIHAAINQHKKKRPTSPLLFDVPAAGSRAEERLDIRRAIAALDDKTRLCVVLYYFEDMPVSEVAEAVGIRAGTVKSRLHRARGKLRQILEGYDHDEL